MIEFLCIGYIGIPSILVTSSAGFAIEALMAKDEEGLLIELTPNDNGNLANIWIELAYTLSLIHI